MKYYEYLGPGVQGRTRWEPLLAELRRAIAEALGTFAYILVSCLGSASPDTSEAGAVLLPWAVRGQPYNLTNAPPHYRRCDGDGAHPHLVGVRDRAGLRRTLESGHVVGILVPSCVRVVAPLVLHSGPVHRCSWLWSVVDGASLFADGGSVLVHGEQARCWPAWW